GLDLRHLFDTIAVLREAGVDLHNVTCLHVVEVGEIGHKVVVGDGDVPGDDDVPRLPGHRGIDVVADTHPCCVPGGRTIPDDHAHAFDGGIGARRSNDEAGWQAGTCAS